MMRLWVRPDGLTATWRHELDPPGPDMADWLDLTDLDDDEFTAIVTALQKLL